MRIYIILVLISLFGCGKSSKPSMVLIMVDTLRADILTCYGYEKETSPSITRLSRVGMRFENVVAASPWTAPSVAGITTGRYPDEVGVRDLQDALPKGVTTLAERLKLAGYATGAVVSNTLAGPEYGFDQGYDYIFCERYKDPAEGVPSFTADEVTDKAIEWLDTADDPFFLYVHYTDPHDPYLPPARWRDKFLGSLEPLDEGYLVANRFADEVPDEKTRKTVKALYEAEVAFMDHEVGRLIQHLAPETVVVLTGDHGEEFSEHGGYLHGHTLYEELLNVPLIFRGPQVAPGTTIYAPVSHVDITPTLLDLAGLPGPGDLSGQSLVPVFRNPVKKMKTRPLFSVLENRESRGVSLRQGPWKLKVRTERAPKKFFAALYNLEEDPGEKKDIAPNYQDRVSSLIEILRARNTRLMEPEVRGDDAARKRREEELRALGYIR